jgi:hypothetical protein
MARRLAQRRTRTLDHRFVPGQKPELTIGSVGVVSA